MIEPVKVNFDKENTTPGIHNGRGLVLAIGEAVFRQPQIGICTIIATHCGIICWAWQAHPEWALVGGLLEKFFIPVFSYWMNSY
jgi:hypothetical protein